MSDIIYLASPYSHVQQSVVEYRYNQTLLACRLLMRDGYNVFSPIVHCHDMVNKFSLPPTADYWENWNYAFLDKSAAIVALLINGWDMSVGLTAEMDRAYNNQIARFGMKLLPHDRYELLPWEEVAHAHSRYADIHTG